MEHFLSVLRRESATGTGEKQVRGTADMLFSYGLSRSVGEDADPPGNPANSWHGGPASSPAASTQNATYSAPQKKSQKKFDEGVDRLQGW